MRKKRKQQRKENHKMMSKQDFLQRGLDDQYSNNNVHYTSYSLPPLLPSQNRIINENDILSYENEKQQPQQQQYQPTSPSPLYTVTTDPNNSNDIDNDHKSRGIKSYGAQLNYDIFNSSEFDFLHQQQQQHHHEK